MIQTYKIYNILYICIIYVIVHICVYTYVCTYVLPGQVGVIKGLLMLCGGKNH